VRAVQYRTIGRGPELVDIATPDAGPGEVRLRVLAAGVFHTDLTLIGVSQRECRFELPMTLGHEAVGVVDQLGPGVRGIEIGEAVAVYGPQGCGRCGPCAGGAENYCERAGGLGISPPGLGSPGAMAEHLVVSDARFLVSLDGVDPVAAVPLTDAGLTSYHAIAAARHRLRPGSTTLVIGVGGLGHTAIQILRSTTATIVIALDVQPAKLALAERHGAHITLMSDHRAADAIRRATRGTGVDVVLDFVVNQSTIDLGQSLVRGQGEQVLVGVGKGSADVGIRTTPPGAAVRATYWGTRQELVEVLALARSGLIAVATETFALEDVGTAFERLRTSTVEGRAVLLPQGTARPDAPA